MAWIKKKGLYLPDTGSYAESVNDFQDDYGTPAYLYIRVGFRIPFRVSSTSSYSWTAIQKGDWYVAYTLYRHDYEHLANRLHARFGISGQGEEWSCYPQGVYGVYEVFARLDSSKTLNRAYSFINRVMDSTRPYFDISSLADTLSKLRVNPAPADVGPYYIDHLIIHNDWPSWADKDYVGPFDIIKSTYPSFDDAPLAVDLHWAMEEGLIDPSQFLHFYTFEELDENGNIPDYGSNPQPLALYGNAQLAEAWEVEPQFSPTIVYELHALRTEAKMRALRMKAKMRKGV